MSDTSAYNLRLRDPVFADAWEAALEIGADRIDHSALGRSIRGVVARSSTRASRSANTGTSTNG